jgi:hypothetical protein
MMEHKAFIFDYDSFSRELKPILETALQSGNSERLIVFIEANHAQLKDPYEGEPLDENWMETIDSQDPHQFGDFALTKYYDPANDTGLGADWQRVQDILPQDLTESPILGTPLGPKGNLFDPGKMGSYFQANDQVSRNIEYLRTCVRSRFILSPADEPSD